MRAHAGFVGGSFDGKVNIVEQGDAVPRRLADRLLDTCPNCVSTPARKIANAYSGSVSCILARNVVIVFRTFNLLTCYILSTRRVTAEENEGTTEWWRKKNQARESFVFT